MNTEMENIKNIPENACGAFVVQMALSLLGITEDVMDIYYELKIEEKGYTSKENLRAVFDKRNIQYKELNNSDLNTLKEKVNQKKPVIVNWSPEPDNGHYSIITHYDESTQEFTLKDSDQTEYLIDCDEFDQKWISGNGEWVKWYMQILGKKEQ